MSSSSESAGSHATQGSLTAVSLAALGIVYGDIGTSPLYALRECFHGPHAIPLTELAVLGVLSTVFWVLIATISIKYMLFVLRADNRGEGGILALMALVAPVKAPRVTWLLALGIFGAALLYGEGIITPAVSVLSAVEGLELATPIFSKWVIPITVAILCGLFWFQRKGTASIGAVFGPIMLVWFFTLGVLGVFGITKYPAVLAAVNPWYVWDLIAHHPTEAFTVMGTVFLVATGGEALYADLGHFGKKPMRMAWFVVVLPGLVLNYFGQGAILISDPAAQENPFYRLAPEWALIPLVVLATSAAVIASQAMISGVFSLTRQAIQLGLWPRMQIIHTSNREIGQIYLPHMNAALFVGCVWLVLSFKNSSNLVAAYGFGVAMTMVINTIFMAIVERKVWKWSWPAIFLSTAVFLTIDVYFFAANSVKIPEGGYLPLFIGAGFFTLMSTWKQGRAILGERLRRSVMKFQDFYSQLKESKPIIVEGTAFFMVGDAETTPPAFVHNVKHNHVLHERVVILTVTTKEIPTVAPSDRVRIERIDERMWRVIAKYGFTDTPDVIDIVDSIRASGVPIEMKDITFFLGRETLIASATPGMALWREHLFAFMSRNAQRATAYFNIPADQVIEVGIQVEI